MSTSAREEILGRIRTALGPGRDTAAALQEAARTRQCRVRPDVIGDVEALFRIKAEANLIALSDVASLDDIPATVARLLAGRVPGEGVSVAPALAHLSWPQDLAVRCGKARLNEKATVSSASAAIAETGSVVLCSGSEAPSSLTFAGEVHVIVLRRGDIVRFIDEALAKVKAAHDPFPRTVNVVSGPSRTADVAGIVVRPAHGPKAVHVLIYG